MKYRRLGRGCYQIAERHTLQTPIKGWALKDVFATLYVDGTLELHKFFTWDGATGAIDSDSIMEASAAHDVFCDWINREYLPEHFQKTADKFLVDTMEAYWKRQQESTDFFIRFKAKTLHPFAWLRRKWVYRAVRVYQKNKQKGQAPTIHEVV